MDEVLKHVPRFQDESAEAFAEKYFNVRADAWPLPSERDQNFQLTTSTDEKYVLKIANALEERSFLEAQNSVLTYLAQRVSFCQRVVPSVSGEEIVTITSDEGAPHFVRLVNYIEGVTLAGMKPCTASIARDLGRKIGELERALVDFDHTAAHRNFHWDLANGNRIVDEFRHLIKDTRLRELVYKCRFDLKTDLRRSVIHGDPNDYNIIVDPEGMTVSGLLDFGDMVYSYTVGDLAIAIAYVVLDVFDPLEVATEVVAGYRSEFALLDDELEALWPLVRLRLGVSVCMAAYQQQQQPENEYLSISQTAIAKNLERLLAADLHG